MAEIKDLTQKIYRTDFKFVGKTDEKDEDSEYLYMQIVYDKDGNVTDLQEFSQEGELKTEKNIFENGRLVSKSIDNPVEGTKEFCKLEYPQDDKIVERNFYEDGSNDKVITYTRPGKELNRIEYYETEADITSVEYYDYNNSGQLVKKYQKDREGAIIESESYSYDDAGNMNKTEGRDEHGDHFTVELYYNDSNEKEEEIHIHNGVEVERKTFKYTEDQKLACEESWVNDAQVKKIEIDYDDAGNIVREHYRDEHMTQLVQREFENNRLSFQIITVNTPYQGTMNSNYSLRFKYD